MHRRQWMLFGALATLLSTAFAQQQALITVNPNNFSAGQNISNANVGAQLLSFSAAPNPDPNHPGTVLPNYLPVYAQPVAASCIIAEAVPCAVGGNLALGYSPTTVPAANAILWGDEGMGASCLLEFSLFSFCDPELGALAFEPVLRVNFTTPTDFAAAVVGYFLEDDSVIEAFEAFDGSGNSLGRCIAPIFGTPPTLPPAQSDPPGCATAVLTGPHGGWALFTISRPTADIGFILVGGVLTARPVAQVQFHSPVTLQLAGLLAAVQGVGPGKSLANTVLQAQADYAAGDILATCPLLASFVDEVNAQNGKHIDHLTALQLLSTVTAIQTAIACR